MEMNYKKIYCNITEKLIDIPKGKTPCFICKPDDYKDCLMCDNYNKFQSKSIFDD